MNQHKTRPADHRFRPLVPKRVNPNNNSILHGGLGYKDNGAVVLQEIGQGMVFDLFAFVTGQIVLLQGWAVFGSIDDPMTALDYKVPLNDISYLPGNVPFLVDMEFAGTSGDLQVGTTLSNGVRVTGQSIMGAVPETGFEHSQTSVDPTVEIAIIAENSVNTGVPHSTLDYENDEFHGAIFLETGQYTQEIRDNHNLIEQVGGTIRVLGVYNVEVRF